MRKEENRVWWTDGCSTTGAEILKYYTRLYGPEKLSNKIEEDEEGDIVGVSFDGNTLELIVKK